MKFSSRGFTFLEQALAFPVIIGLLFAFYDTANFYKAKAAVHEANVKAMRCLTPIEGDCVQMSPQKTEAYYDAYLSNLLPQWSVPQYKFTGIGEWLSRPLYNYFDPTVRILNNATYQQRTLPVSRIINNTNPNVNALVTYYIMKANKPFANTGTGERTKLNPDFYYKENQIVEYPSIIKNKITNIDVRVSKSEGLKRVASLEFTLPALSTYYRCFRSERLNHPNGLHPADFNKACNMSEIPVVLHLTGLMPRTNNIYNSRGRMLMKLREKNGDPVSINMGQGFQQDSEFNLEGRILEQSSGDLGGDLVPRGLGEGFYSDDRGYEEYSKYEGIKLSAGKTYVLSLWMEKTNEDTSTAQYLNWVGQNFAVYTAQYDVITLTDLPCSDYSLIPGTSEYKCNSVTINGVSFTGQQIATSKSSPTITKTYEPLGCFDLATVSNTYANTSQFLIDYNDNGKSCKNTKSITIKCPADNIGVTSNPNTSDNSYKEALIACPISDPYIDTSNKVIFTEVDKVLTGLNFDYLIETCKTPLEPPESSLPSQYTRYKQRKDWNTKVLTDSAFYTGTIPVDEFIQKNPDTYQCPQIKKVSREFNDEALKELDYSDTYFFGLHTKEVLGCDYNEIIKNDAVKLGLNPAAYFKASEEFADQYFVKTEPVFACYEGVKTYYAEGEKKKIEGGPFLANQLPIECYENGKGCTLEFAKYETTPSHSSVDFINAYNRGFETIRVVHPQAVKPCEDLKCAKIIDNGEDKNAEIPCPSDLPNCVSYTASKDNFEFRTNFALSVPNSFLHKFGAEKIITVSDALKDYSEYKYLSSN